MGLAGFFYQTGWRHRKLIRSVVPSAILKRTYDIVRWTTYRRAVSGFHKAKASEFARSLPFGLNIIGHLHAESGVGEAARSTIRAAHAADIPLSLVDYRTGHPSRMEEELPEGLPSGDPYTINIVHVNANEIPTLFAEMGRAFFERHYNIGYWNWELPRFPPQWREAADIFHEIWVPSRFVAESVRKVLDLPVRRLPISIPSLAQAGRAALRPLNLPPNTFVFLTLFDALSVPERKNPLAAVEAFRLAFPGVSPGKACLVLKVSSGHRNRPLMSALNSISRNDGRIFVVDQYLDRCVLNTLLGVSGALVSLHRAEGFGITLAEAMRLGKPVIATGWSGNMDFMDSGNSFPVRSDLVSIPRTYGPYRRGNRWAEPDVVEAARLMRQVFENRDAAAHIGHRARQDIRKNLSPAVVGGLLSQMLRHVPETS